MLIIISIYFLVEAFTEDGFVDVVLADYGPTWESLRRVAHAAVRKYAVDEKFALLVNDVIVETIETIKKEKELTNHLILVITSVLLFTVF